MADSGSKSGDLARNRENQRRSRQRRIDYVASLEQKVRQYEAAGVQASQELQNAARLVVHENHVLKSFLYSLGQSEADVAAKLRASSLGLERQPVAKSDQNVLETQSIDVPSDAPKNEPTKVASEATPKTCCPHRSNSGPKPKTTETACEEAARIIAGMRGDPGSSDIWAELGCKGEASCNISNTKIFELLDH